MQLNAQHTNLNKCCTLWNAVQSGFWARNRKHVTRTECIDCSGTRDEACEIINREMSTGPAYLTLKPICIFIDTYRYKIPSHDFVVVVSTILTGHAVAQWLRHYVTSREFAGSRPDEVNDFFFFSIYLIPPTALGPGVYSARSRKYCFWGAQRGRCVRLTTLPSSVSRLSRQGDPQHLTTL
jgi:hypothetical protein